MSKDYLGIKIGIIGGGQLGKMMILEAKKLGFYVTVLDPTPTCPARSISDKYIEANFDDKEAICRLAELSDVITYEFEHIGVETLLELENAGHKIYPTAKSLKIIQNKYSQKTVLQSASLPIPDFMEINCTEDMLKAGDLYGYPYMLKTCTGGYDGKGNAVVKDKDDISNAYMFLGGGNLPLMAEKMVDFIMETSILACRGANGDIAIYPVGDNRHVDSILHQTIVPANIPQQTTEKAMEAAHQVMEVFGGIGMFCIEMFVTKNNDILINEIAPRPHNSGHYTIEGCITSQFDNHIRAITGLPLGDTSLIRPTVMVNLLGEPDYKGSAFVTGLYDALSIKGVFVHIYGKAMTSPKRKMGHLTVTADSSERALELGMQAYNKIKIISKQEV